MTADEIIELLQLQPHPEGGAFRETYRASVSASTPDRTVCTAIYFLLRGGKQSAWHRVKSDELYHYYSGDPMEVRLIGPDGHLETHILGSDLMAGQRPQLVIAADTWQAARSLGEYTLIGCTVSPGFDFRDFEMITADELRRRYPQTKIEVQP